MHISPHLSFSLSISSSSYSRWREALLFHSLIWYRGIPFRLLINRPFSNGTIIVANNLIKLFWRAWQSAFWIICRSRVSYRLQFLTSPDRFITILPSRIIKFLPQWSLSNNWEPITSSSGGDRGDWLRSEVYKLSAGEIYNNNSYATKKIGTTITPSY